ncbi:MAG: DUF86 domain-containing protein [Acidobacteria bacterium]|nr:DUF86 domain-containing protein [Acidobacteriota bacterium]
MRDDRQRLLDILEAIQRIEKYASQGGSAFEREELIQNWVLRHLQIIGEACRSVSSGFQNQHPDIPWSQVIGMRNILVHHYFEMDVDAVWLVVERDLPILKRKLEALLERAD